MNLLDIGLTIVENKGEFDVHYKGIFVCTIPNNNNILNDLKCIIGCKPTIADRECYAFENGRPHPFEIAQSIGLTVEVLDTELGGNDEN